MKKKPFVFSPGLQWAVALIRAGGLTEGDGYPNIVSPVYIIFETKRNTAGKKVKVVRFLVKVEVRRNLDPWIIWVKFNKRGSSVSISFDDKKHWMGITVFKHLITG